MFNINRTVIVVILIVIAIVVMVYYRDVKLNEDLMSGMWIADDKFCEEADVESMLVYFGRPDGTGSITRNGYIVIGPDVSNQGFVLKYAPLYSPFDRTLTATIDFDVDQLWPKDIDIVIDAAAGSMRIYKDSKLYARLYRENMLSDTLRT